MKALSMSHIDPKLEVMDVGVEHATYINPGLLSWDIDLVSSISFLNCHLLMCRVRWRYVQEDFLCQASSANPRQQGNCRDHAMSVA